MLLISSIILRDGFHMHITCTSKWLLKGRLKSCLNNICYFTCSISHCLDKMNDISGILTNNYEIKVLKISLSLICKLSVFCF